MKALIRTLPLRTGNYGGILQAWALQTALRDLGVDPVTDISVRPRSRAARTLAAIGRPARNLLPGSLDLLPGDARWRGDVRVREFVSREIATTSLFRPYATSVRASRLNRFDAFIVGSDQVWRSDYADVPSYLFDFLAKDDPRPRIAYAASFGSLEANAWGPNEVEGARSLMNRFTAIGCRESSGAEWIRETLSVDAVTVPDPTLLLDRDRYARLVRDHGEARGVPSNRYVLTYALDRNVNQWRQVNDVASTLNSQVFDVRASGAPGSAPRPSPAEWLSLISHAQLVVTDSFHGMLFAALLGRPQIVIPNRQRGLDRFDALAEMLGANPLLPSEASLADWVRSGVLDEERPGSGEVALAQARKRGLVFLRDSLDL